MSGSDLQKFRINLKIVRINKGITAKELSMALKMKAQKRIADIEEGRGMPDMGEIMDICRYFAVPIDSMLYQNAKVHIEFS